MAQSSLIPYSIQLRRKGETDSFINLHDLDQVINWTENSHISESPSDFIDLLEQIFQSLWNEPFIDHSQQNTFTVSKYEVSPSQKFAEGVFHSGAFGKNKHHLSIDGSGRIKEREENTSVGSLFYSFFRITKNNPETGICFLERQGRRGIKTMFNHILQSSIPSDYLIEINPISGPASKPDSLPKITGEILSLAGVGQRLDSSFSDTASPDKSSFDDSSYCTTPNIDRLFDQTVDPYKYFNFRRSDLAWQSWLLLCASMTDEGDLSSEITETQKIVVRTSVATLLGMAVTMPFEANAGVVIGAIALFSTIFESRYSVESDS